jgi:diguanylate cyclase (GGDEF)-like protein/PAS domain S-box-containing protein
MLAPMLPQSKALVKSPRRRRAAAAWGMLVLALAGPMSAFERSHFFAPMAKNEELTQGAVHAMLQDRDGLVWIGTQGGLHRFDGHELKAFHYQSGVAGSLPENFVTALAETGDGRLFVGTSRNGVVRLDRGRGHFEPVGRNEPGTNRNLVTALAADTKGRLWIGSQHGVARLDADGRSKDALVLAGRDFRMVRDLAVCPDGDVLVAAANGAWHIRPDRPEAVRIGSANEVDFSAAHCAADGSKRFAGRDSLYVVAGEALRREWTPADAVPASVLDIVEDGSGRLWLARLGHGLVAFDPDSGAARQFERRPQIPGTLQETTVRSLALDRSGLLWIGGDLRGVAITDPDGAAFTYLHDESAGSDEDAMNNVRALLADGTTGLWIGSEGEGLRHYDFKTRRLSQHRGVGILIAGRDQPYSQRIGALASAEGGRLWVGTPFGLALFDPASGSGTRFVVDPERRGDRTTDVRALAHGADGTLWIGTFEHGLLHFDPPRRRWIHYGAGNGGGKPGLAHATVLAVHEDRGGRVWIGTLGGLHVLDRASGRMHAISGRNGDDEGLAGESVRAILETRDGAIWIGTHGGLNQLLSFSDGHARFRAWRIADGLANDTIYGLLDDPAGRIWASTNRGMLVLDPRSGDILNFSHRDGLQSSEYNGGAQARLGDGRLAFGGTRGVNWVDPTRIAPSQFEPPLAFTSVQIGSRRRQIDDPGQFRAIALGADDRVLMLGFAALDFAAPERTRFRYRLRGYDERWIDLGTRREVAFTNLAPGEYVLEVLGSNRDGRFSGTPLSASVLVAPAWWQTPWARLALAALLTLAVSGYIVWRRRELSRLRAQNDQLKLFSDRLSLALWASRDGFWDWDIRNDRMFLSGPEEFLGGMREALIPADLWRDKVLHPDDRERVLATLDAHVHGERDHYEAEYRIFIPGRRIVWVAARGRATAHDADGRALRIAGTFRDIGQERDRDRERRIAQEVIRSMGEAVCVTGLDYRFTSINAAFTRITGYADHEVIGVEASLLDSDQHPREFFLELRATMNQRGHWSGEIWQRRKDGEQFLSWLEINEVRDANGERTHWVAVISDITDRKRAEQELRYLANYDTLTGLPNRTLLSERLAHALIRARRLGSKVAVLFLDLDRFKHVNDSMGHAAGDRLLKSAAARIVTSVREADTVARLGGDEFTIILEDLRDGTEAESVAQKILTTFGAPLEIDGRQEVVITPSIGISLYPEHGQLPTDLLKHADTAMYHAKDRGRNMFQVYDDAMDTQVRLRANLASQLQRAMERNELSLVFQPKMALGENRVTGAEALLRWTNGTLGSIPPATFIPIAEETGLIVPIGDWVLREACKQVKRWSEAGLGLHSVAVNVSALQLFRGDLVRRLREILAETRVPAHRLELELTESMLMANPEQSISTLTAIKALGVHLSVDDFGTGYSSLAYLKRLPIDTLKIDKTFVGDLTTDPDDEAIVSTVIMMAHSLGLDVIAEGVETNDQLRYLAEQKCDEVQGNLISAPLDSERILAFLLDRRGRGERTPGQTAT